MFLTPGNEPSSNFALVDMAVNGEKKRKLISRYIIFAHKKTLHGNRRSGIEQSSSNSLTTICRRDQLVFIVTNYVIIILPVIPDNIH